jgi:CheY-like chemotaxis protein
VSPSGDVPEATRIVILADDLIWSTRLDGHVRSAGFRPAVARTAPAFVARLADADAAIVDLTSRAYDGLAAIAAARDLGVPVLAVGQHDDHVLRRDALAVGADRVLAYRKLFEDGPATITRWIESTSRPAPRPAARSTAPSASAEPEEAQTR